MTDTDNTAGRKSHRNALQWTPGFEMDSIPFEVLRSAYKSRIARMGHGGRARTCGHFGEYVTDCEICLRAKALKEKRDKEK